MGRGHWPVKAESYCGACGAPLPPREPGRRGADQAYCKADTGRPCSDFARAVTRMVTLARAIERGTPPEYRNRVQGKLGGAVQALAPELLPALAPAVAEAGTAIRYAGVTGVEDPREQQHAPRAAAEPSEP